MTRKAIRSGITTGCLVAAALSLAALATFYGDGVSFEAGGLELTLKGSIDQGLQLVFAKS